MPTRDAPPPSRYRITERAGRIIVTDTWAEQGRPETRRATPPPAARAEISRIPEIAARRQDSAMPTDRIARLRDALVRLACLGAADDTGLPILTTHVHFDEKGPRSIVLNPVGIDRLGKAALGVVGVVAALVVLLFVWDFAGILAIAVVGLAFTSINTTARPALTRWLDTLGADAGDVRPR